MNLHVFLEDSKFVFGLFWPPMMQGVGHGPGAEALEPTPVRFKSIHFIIFHIKGIEK